MSTVSAYHGTELFPDLTAIDEFDVTRAAISLYFAMKFPEIFCDIPIESMQQFESESMVKKLLSCL